MLEPHCRRSFSLCKEIHQNLVQTQDPHDPTLDISKVHSLYVKKFIKIQFKHKIPMIQLQIHQTCLTSTLSYPSSFSLCKEIHQNLVQTQDPHDPTLDISKILNKHVDLAQLIIWLFPWSIVIVHYINIIQLRCGHYLRIELA